MVTEDEFQQKAYEFEMYRQELANIQKQLQELSYRIQELDLVLNSLEAIKKNNGDEEIIVPIGQGVYIKTKIVDKKDILIDVGSNVIIEKDIDKAIEYVKERFDEISKYIDRLNKDAQYFTTKLQELEPILNKMSQELRKE